MALISNEKKAVIALVLQYLTKGKISMNTEQFKSLLRLLAGIAAGWAVGKGFGDATVWEVITGGFVAAGALIWGQVTHSK